MRESNEPVGAVVEYVVGLTIDAQAPEMMLQITQESVRGTLRERERRCRKRTQRCNHELRSRQRREWALGKARRGGRACAWRGERAGSGRSRRRK
jgi:hypothetical protein